MTKRFGLAVGMAVLCAPFLFAQVSNPSIVPVTSAPSGSCSTTLPLQLKTPDGTLYSCKNGSWAISSGVGASSIAPSLIIYPDSTGAALGALGGLSTYPGGYNCYGDSITAGYGATTNSDAYCYLVAADIDKNGPFNNYGVAGYTALDMSVRVFNTANPGDSGNPVVTDMIGTNDANKPDSDLPSWHLAFLLSDYASNAWLALSSTDKVNSQSSLITQAGTWAASSVFAEAPGLTSSTTGSTLTDSTAQVGPSGVMYVWYYLYQSGGGTFTVSVDGTTQTDTISGVSSISSTSGGDFIYATSYPVVGMARFSGISQGTHSVVITVNSSSGEVGIIGLGFPPASRYQGPTAPAVVVGGVPYQQNNTNATNVDAYNSLVASEVSTLDADGLDVRFVPVQSYLNYDLDFASTATQNCPASTAPGLHPNNCGHRHLANAFESAIGSYSYNGITFPQTFTNVAANPAMSTLVPGTNEIDPGLNYFGATNNSAGDALANSSAVGGFVHFEFQPNNWRGRDLCMYPQGTFTSVTQCTAQILTDSYNLTGTWYEFLTQNHQVIPTSTITTGAGPSSVSSVTNTGYWWNQDATTTTAVTYDLPTAVSGGRYCFGNSNNGTAPDTGVLTVATSGTGQYIIGPAGTLSASGGNATSGGAAGDYACFVGISSTQWQIVNERGTWTIH